MGGWRNWSQNVLNGPPMPAPPSFTGLALAGLAALSLIEEATRWLTAIPATMCWPSATRRRGTTRPERSSTQRLAIDPEPARFFTDAEWRDAEGAVRSDRATAGRAGRPAPLAAMIDEKLAEQRRDGYRDARLPPMRRGLAAGPRGARRRGPARGTAAASTRSTPREQDESCKRGAEGRRDHEAWGGMPSKLFFDKRVLHDIVGAYYAHPTAWNEIGFGGPASPARLCADGLRSARPWEASEARPGREQRRGGRTPVSDDARAAPARHRRPRAGRVPARRLDADARSTADDEAVDFAIVGTGAGGGTLACKLAEYGFSVVALDAGPYWRPLEDFASDERHQAKLYWTDERIVDGENPLELGANNSGKSVGGSTVHFAMVSLRFRPEWFKARSKLGYGADWPLDWREMWRYYARGRAGAEDFRPGELPLGSEAAALSLPAARAQRRRPGARRGRRSARHRLVADAARHRLGAARPCRRPASIAACA